MRFLLKKTTNKLSDTYQLHLKETKMVSGGSGPNKDKDPKIETEKRTAVYKKPPYN
ncbi:hypothetical protein HUZ36_06900 [Pseudoalteromonas sp. McH1-7]|uniref:hypothetical protein n=1 Tax=Pseudoalteromonas sp. McH1-7 TaxID=2745574 RepID=UPI0015919E8D|nr:hypothetical protein [Pseudoalteromonas sp. McH1-7]NUZ10501.1 hypothetical protein [Pseudoalteromonas sp. McH1-7]